MLSKVKHLAQSALSIFGIRTEHEPPYRVADRLAGIEVRIYDKRTAAQTSVKAGDSAKARSEAFNILAGYLFGKNKERRAMPMTAPVAAGHGRDIAMTAPVETRPDDGGALTMRFFLPAGMTAANAPPPDDARVHILEVPPQRLAVLTFSGGWSDALLAQKHSELITALKRSPWRADGTPFNHFYDPPFALPFLRRNEVAVRVRR